jgi:hypothetical protein
MMKSALEKMLMHKHLRDFRQEIVALPVTGQFNVLLARGHLPAKAYKLLGQRALEQAPEWIL